MQIPPSRLTLVLPTHTGQTTTSTTTQLQYTCFVDVPGRFELFGRLRAYQGTNNEEATRVESLANNRLLLLLLLLLQFCESCILVVLLLDCSNLLTVSFEQL